LDHVRAAVDRAVDASGSIIVIAYDRAGALALEAVPAGHPMAAAVETPASKPAEDRPWVWIDDEEAAHTATRFLLDLDHRTVHYVAIPSSTSASRRTAGWRAALQEAGLQIPEPAGTGWDAPAGYEAGQKLARDPRATAILCGNDDLALGVIRAMHEAGRTIPDSVSVVGFDNAPQSRYYTPSLTTTNLDFVGLGRACFRQLHGVLADSAEPHPHPVGRPELIVRESTGPYNLSEYRTCGPGRRFGLGGPDRLAQRRDPDLLDRAEQRGRAQAGHRGVREGHGCYR
jgi:DNA-binding LacI/PurR family transcriptional regulator